jgi:glycosyltransferase involved in cell wall biosynthesis
LRILHIIPTLSKGGAERLVLDILTNLNKRDNIEIRLVIFRDEVKYDISEIKELISIIHCSVKLSLIRKWQVNVSHLQNYMDEFQPDVIHTHLFEAELVSRFCNYPKALWYSHVHDNMTQLNNWNWLSITKTKITNWYEKQTLFKQYKKNGGTHFIAISKHTESYIKSVQSKYPTTLLHNAINVKRFQKPKKYQKITEHGGPNEVKEPKTLKSNIGHYTVIEPRTSTTLNSQFSILNLINIGSFVSKKNQTFLLDIILELNKKGIQTSCFFLGDGPLKPEVEKRAIKLGVINQCHFIGNVDKVEEYLWQSNVYIHTATYEPLGLVLLEAMAAGLPVVSLDGGGNRDLVINGKNGYLIEKPDPELFSNRILEVYQNKEMSNFNAAYAKKFDIESYCEKLVEIYKTQKLFLFTINSQRALRLSKCEIPTSTT